MNKFTIQTAQNVRISQNLASLGLRISAFLIDIFFLILFYYFIFNILEVFVISYFEIWSLMSFLSLFYLLYYPVFQYFNNGQTLGKQIVRIRVVKINNTHPKLGDFLLRWIFRLFEVNIFPGLALFIIILTKKKQRLGDIVAKTTVIYENRYIDLTQSIFEDIAIDYHPHFLQVQVLSDKDIQLIKDIFIEAKQRKNINLLKSLTYKIEDLLKISKPKNLSYDQFIDIIIKDFNYFSHK